MSLYAAGRFGALYALAQFATGVCALGMAAALIAARAPLPGVGLVAVVTLGLARLPLATVPARLADRDAPQNAPPRRGVVIHQLLALVSFASIAIVTVTLTAPLIGWSAWRGPAPPLIAATILTPLADLAFPLTGLIPWLRPYFGLAQRAIYVGIILWQTLALIPLAR